MAALSRSFVLALKRKRAAALLAILSLQNAADASAAEARSEVASALHIRIGQPEGFENLTAMQEAVVDLYFGGKRIGDARVRYEPGWVEFVDPAAVASKIPNLANPAAIRAALGEPRLAGNRHLVCTRGADPFRCGRLAPEIAGVIFDESRFRLDLFVNPRQLALAENTGPRYLPAPEGGLSLVNSVSAVMSGSSGGANLYNFQNRLVLGDGDRRVRAEVSWSSGFGFQADRLAVEIDRPGRRYVAGAFWAQGSDLIGRRKLVGLGIETQVDTRLDKDNISGIPLILFLNQRSRIEVLREGRLLTTQILEAGNQALDTTGLPDGAYEVVLQITETGGAKREERRFFSKNRALPALGEKQFFAYGGVLADDTRRGFINPTGVPFFQAGMARRLNERMAIDATVMATDRIGIAELGVYRVSPVLQSRLAVLAATDGTYGAVLRTGTTGNGRINVDFDLRHIRLSRSTRFPASGAPPGSPIGREPGDPLALLPTNRSYTQLTGNLSYSHDAIHLRLAGTVRRTEGLTEYSVGPSLRVDVLQRGPWRLSAMADYARTERGSAGFVGLSLNLTGSRASVSGFVAARSSNLEGPRQTEPVGSLHANWQAGEVAGGELSLGAGFDRDLTNSVVSGNGEYRGRHASLRADVSHNLRNQSGRTQYSLGFETTIAVRGSGIAVEGRGQNESLVMVRAGDEAGNGEFEVLVNDAPKGTISSGGTLAISLTPYRQYDVRIRQTGGDLVRYDGMPRQIALYPGNVARMAWTARPVVAMFGRLVDGKGQPVANAHIALPGGIGQTDNSGYFQIEAERDSQISVALPGGNHCEITLPQVTVENQFARLGTLVCQPLAPGVRLSSTSPSRQGAPFNGETSDVQK